MRLTPPTLKVKDETTARNIVEIADVMLVSAEYLFNGRWYVISFDCTDYQFQFLRNKIRKELKQQK